LAVVLPRRGQRPTEVRRVLIVRPDRRVGNQVITSCLVHALASQRPEIDVHYLAPEGRQDLVAGLPGLSTVHVLPRRPWGSLSALWGLMRHLRGLRFDVVIDASHWHSFSLTAAVLARLSGAAWSVGHARPGAVGLLDEWVPVPHQGHWPSELTVKMSLLTCLGLDRCTPQTQLPEAPGHDDAIAWWAKHGTGANRVLLWPSTRKATTEIPGGLWPHVLGALPLPQQATVAVGWGPGEEAMADQLVRAIQGVGFDAVRLPETSILELAHLMSEADVVVSGDTGPMHVAGACAPSVWGVFRQDDGARWLPHGDQNRGFMVNERGDVEEMIR
jgi:heptosyltransferase-1